MTSTQITLRVYIEDTDAAGIVYYVNYLKFMERARTEMLRSMGYAKAALFADDKMFVVHSVQCNYLASAGLDDELLVTAGIVKTGRTYVLFEQRVERGNQLLCTAEIKVACVTRAEGKPVAIPVAMLESIKACV